MFILDTDHMSILEHQRGADAQALLSRLDRMAERDVATTIVSFEEQTRGWISYLAKQRKMAGQIEAYVRLKRMLINYGEVLILDFDARAAVEFQRLARARLRIGTMDLKIAAIALAHEATLLTRNLSDFGRVPGLKTENWTIA